MDKRIITKEIEKLQNLIEELQEANELAFDGEGHAELAELELLNKLAVIELPRSASPVIRSFVLANFDRINKFILNTESERI